MKRKSRLAFEEEICDAWRIKYNSSVEKNDVNCVCVCPHSYCIYSSIEKFRKSAALKIPENGRFLCLLSSLLEVN